MRKRKIKVLNNKYYCLSRKRTKGILAKQNYMSKYFIIY
jgi:hypothetical protein